MALSPMVLRATQSCSSDLYIETYTGGYCETFLLLSGCCQSKSLFFPTDGVL